MKNIFLICGLVLLWVNCFGAGLTTSSLNGVATNLTRYGTSTNLAVPQPSSGSTNVIGIDSTGKELSIPIGNFSGGGGGGGGSNLLYNFNTNDFTASLVTNISLSLNVPRTNRNNTFYGTQTFVDILANTLNTSAGAMVGTDLSWGGMGSGDGSGIVNLNATFLTSGTVGTARLGTGAANSGTFLRGDGSWQAVPSAGITALTGDVTASGSGSVVATLANIPTSTPMAGSLFDTAIVAPATPTSGKGQIYEDSTSKNLAIKNDAGVINHGVQTRTATANQWIRSIADDGSSTISQPAFTDISGTASAAQIPVATTSANGGVKVDGTSIIISSGTISAVGEGGGFSNQLNGVIVRGILTKAVNFSGNNGNGMSVGDMNGDGYPDIVQNQDSATVVYTNDRTGRNFVQASTSSGTSTLGGNAVADVNGDGKNDVITSSRTGNYVAVYTNNGVGTLTQIGSNYVYGSGIPSYVTVTPGRLNGTSNIDFLASCGTTNIMLFTNNGAGIFVVATNFPTLFNAASVKVADFNGDGIQDIAFAPSVAFLTSTFGFIVMTNNGSGVFSYFSTNTVPSTTVSAQAITSADFNGDGKNDLAMQFSANAGSVLTYTNSGNGFGFYSSNAFLVTSSGNTLATGDFNGDGKPDILATSIANYDSVLFTNSGYGLGFSSSLTNVHATLTQPQFTAAADFNGDGFLDYAVYQASSSGGIGVYLNAFNTYGNFIGNGNGITNLPISVSFSSSVLTPANSVTTNTTGTVININTNYLPYSATPTLNLSSSTNLSSTNINFGLFPIQTNLISGQLYTNGYNRPVQVQANVGITTAAVTGDAGMALWIISGVGRGTTNYESISTTLAVTLAMSYTNQLGGFIPTNAIYTFTNISSGAGNSATLIGGQIY